MGLGLAALLVSCSSQRVENNHAIAQPDARAQVSKQNDLPTEITDETTDETTDEAIAANEEILEAIAPLQVVYLGETHTTVADHTAQLEIIKTLNSQNELAIGLEMFQRPFQPALDAYLADDITEAELIEQSEYASRWGYDWELYAPIIRFAKANDIPLIALNTPTEVTRQVAGQGLQSLSGDALTYIPPVTDIDTSNEAYKAAIAEVFSAHGGMGHSLSLDNFFAAQVLWDETMADRIVQQRNNDPNRQVVVLVGEGHIAYDYGIPDRVERRLPGVEQASIRLISPEQSAQEPQEPEFADFFWVTQ